MTVTFCAELASNHNGDLARCIDLIRRSAEAGFDIVKVQAFRLDRLYTPEVLAARRDIAARQAWELPLSWLPALAEACEQCGVRLAATAFDHDMVEILAPHVSALKVSSYDILRLDLIEACAATGLDVVISTGMATIDEVEAAILASIGARSLTLLHCVSQYPTPAVAAGVGCIELLREVAPASVVGVSDHSGLPGVIHRAVHRYDARWVELHVDDGEGWDTGPWCWPLRRAATLIRDIRGGIAADGDGQLPPQGQEIERDWRADPLDGLRPMGHLRRT